MISRPASLSACSTRDDRWLRAGIPSELAIVKSLSLVWVGHCFQHGRIRVHYNNNYFTNTNVQQLKPEIHVQNWEKLYSVWFNLKFRVLSIENEVLIMDWGIVWENFYRCGNCRHVIDLMWANRGIIPLTLRQLPSDDCCRFWAKCGNTPLLLRQLSSNAFSVCGCCCCLMDNFLISLTGPITNLFPINGFCTLKKAREMLSMSLWP